MTHPSSGSSASSRSASPAPHLPASVEPLRPIVRGATDMLAAIKANPEHTEKMRKLAEGQAPDYLVISCSDSRYAATDVFRAGPGEIFEKQHVGAIVGDYFGPWVARDRGALATITYAVAVLKVKHVLIMTHTHCGAIKGILQGVKHANLVSQTLHLGAEGVAASGPGWLRQAAGEVERRVEDVAQATLGSARANGLGACVRRATAWGDWAVRAALNTATGHDASVEDLLILAGPVRERVAQNYGHLSPDQHQRAAAAETALLQREHLMTYPVVRRAMEEGTLEDVHAMVFEVDTRVINAYDDNLQHFVPLNDSESGLPKRRAQRG